MKQHEAVISAIEELGDVATLGQLYRDALKISGCEWKTKTPFASIRRIVQTRKEVFKIKPGLYGLTSRRKSLEKRGIIADTEENKDSVEAQKFNHTYYQGLLLQLGNLKGFQCWSPNQDRKKKFITTPLEDLRTMQAIPDFSHDRFVRRSQTIDVIWFNERLMPSRFFEVEHSTDIQNSLLKFHELQDFHTEMFIVASKRREPEFKNKLQYPAFKEIAKRVDFLP